MKVTYIAFKITEGSYCLIAPRVTSFFCQWAQRNMEGVKGRINTNGKLTLTTSFPQWILFHFPHLLTFKIVFANIFRELFVSQMPSSKSFLFHFPPFIQIHEPTTTCVALGLWCTQITSSLHLHVLLWFPACPLQLLWAMWPFLANGLRIEMIILPITLLPFLSPPAEANWRMCFLMDVSVERNARGNGWTKIQLWYKWKSNFNV